jgi:hypothetical protein
MENTDKKDDKSTWAIGGGLLIGIPIQFLIDTETGSLK